LVELIGADRGVIIEALIEQEYHRRAELDRAECPWVIAESAIDDLLRVTRGRPGAPRDREHALEVLVAAAVDADRAELEERRLPHRLDSGALRYRGPRALVLLVEPGTPRPTLRQVLVPGSGDSR
jgi:hypothetical protein